MFTQFDVKPDAFAFKRQSYSEPELLPPGAYDVRHDDMMGTIFTAEPYDNDKPIGLEGTTLEILAEIKNFLGKRQVYKKFGFSHKRGYLLHGPPGCGKSTFLRQLQTDFVGQFGGLVLTGDPILGTEELRAKGDIRPILMLAEDIERYLSSFEERVLEFLDGAAKLDNFVIVATTNFLDKIPARIKNRPSRIDRVVEVGYPPESARYGYLAALGVELVNAREIAQMTAGLSMAHLKEIVIATHCLNQPLEEAVERMRELNLGDPGGFLGDTNMEVRHG